MQHGPFSTTDDAPEVDENLARFEIWPHRSLGALGTYLLVAITGVAGAVVLALKSPTATGATSLIVTPLLAAAVLALAFWSNNRAARRTGERIEIRPDTVRVIRRGASSTEAPVEFATSWVRLYMAQGKVANRILLGQSGRTCSIGECLSPDERAELAEALKAALVRARRQGLRWADR